MAVSECPKWQQTIATVSPLANSANTWIEWLMAKWLERWTDNHKATLLVRFPYGKADENSQKKKSAQQHNGGGGGYKKWLGQLQQAAKYLWHPTERKHAELKTGHGLITNNQLFGVFPISDEIWKLKKLFFRDPNTTQYNCSPRKDARQNEGHICHSMCSLHFTGHRSGGLDCTVPLTGRVLCFRWSLFASETCPSWIFPPLVRPFRPEAAARVRRQWEGRLEKITQVIFCSIFFQFQFFNSKRGRTRLPSRWMKIPNYCTNHYATLPLHWLAAVDLVSSTSSPFVSTLTVDPGSSTTGRIAS